MKLNSGQQTAIQQFILYLSSTDKYCVISGSSGTGKTSLIPHLVEAAKGYYNAKGTLTGTKTIEGSFALTALTNAAVSVFGSLNLDTQSVQWSTLHSFLGLKVQNNYKTGKTTIIQTALKAIFSNVIILFIDEASMLDDTVFMYLERINTPNIKIVFIGDPYQLPPVKQKHITMDNVPATRIKLSQIERNGGLISELGQQYKETVKTGKFRPIRANGAEVEYVDSLQFKQAFKAHFMDSPDRAIILAYTNRLVIKYNQYIRQLKDLGTIFAAEEEVRTNKPIILHSGKVLATTDSIVKIIGAHQNNQALGLPGCVYNFRNTYSYNVHHAFMPDSWSLAKALQQKVYKDKDMEKYFEIKNHWLDLRPTYASTVHKAQGSTFDTVFINLSDIGSCYDANTVARLLYVAITRAKTKVYLHGKLPIRYGG